MKHSKFKKNNLSVKHKIIFTLIMSVTLVLFMTIYISTKISEKTLIYSEKRIKNETTKMFKSSFSKLEFNEDTDDIITLIKKDEEIIGVDFKISKCYTLLKKIVSDFTENLNNYEDNGEILYIPLGYMTDVPFLINLGPKIPIKVSLFDTALGSVKTNVSSYGINNVLIEIYIEINVSLDDNLPLKKDNIKIEYSALLSSKIVAGKVPNIYSGNFSKQSEDIYIPIE